MRFVSLVFFFFFTWRELNPNSIYTKLQDLLVLKLHVVMSHIVIIKIIVRLWHWYVH